ncbi:MAG: hypothetical protein ACOC45_03665 [Alkalispirochaetaceae bacterium]
MTPLGRRLTFTLLLLLLSPTGMVRADEEGLYRSNDQFLPIEEISPEQRERYPWVLELSVSAGRREGVLYRDGELYRRRIEILSPRGTPREVQILDAAGERIERWQYRYDRTGRLRGIEVDGLDGRSRFSTGLAPEGSGTSGETLFRAEDESRTVYRYDEAGRLATASSYRSGELIERLTNTWEEERLAMRVREYPRERRRVVTRYDESGDPAEEEAWEAGRLVSTTYRSYGEEGELLGIRVTGRQAREIRYEYDEEGTLVSERELREGVVHRSVEYGEDERVETRYRRGEAFLRVYYRGDERVREELLREGEVIDVRRF